MQRVCKENERGKVSKRIVTIDIPLSKPYLNKIDFLVCSIGQSCSIHVVNLRNIVNMSRVRKSREKNIPGDSKHICVSSPNYCYCCVGDELCVASYCL